MTEADMKALRRLVGGGDSGRATTDDLQGLLLQVVFALLMVFMIAYFIFVETSKKERAEQVMELNRQKLVLALEKVAEDHRVKYGLNALMTQGTDGRRTFDADEHVKGGRIDLAPAAKAAFSSGSAAAFGDYSDVAALVAAWKAGVLAEAKLAEGARSRRFVSTPAACSARLRRVCSGSGSTTRRRSAGSPIRANLRTR